MAGELIAHGAQILAIDIEDLARLHAGPCEGPRRRGPPAPPAPLCSALSKRYCARPRGTGVRVYLCGITVASVDQMPAYLHLGVHHFAAEPAALLPLKKQLMEENLG